MNKKTTRLDEWHYTLSSFFLFRPSSYYYHYTKPCIFICPVQMEDKSHEEDIAVFLFLDSIFPAYSCLFALLCLSRRNLTREYTSSV